MLRLFNDSTLETFWTSHADARDPLLAWFQEVDKASWTGPQDIEAAHASASFLVGDRVVFNIKGNTYRLVVHVSYPFHNVFIRFIGTQAEYDNIDATTV